MEDVRTAYAGLIEEKKAMYPWVFYSFLYGLIEQYSWGEYFKEGGGKRHLSPEKICALFSERALQQFGKFTFMVMEYWGVHSGQDIGVAVMQLAERGCFTLSGDEKLEDFKKAGLFFK